MHLLTTSYFHCHEWGPHTDSPHSCQIVRAKTFHNTSSIRCWEKPFLGFAPNRTLGEVCLGEHAEPQRASSRNREAGCFSQKSRRASYYLRSFMWSKCLFLSWAELVILVFPTLFCRNTCLSVSDGDCSICKDNNYHECLNKWITKSRDHLPHKKCSVSMVAIKSMSISQCTQM